MAILSVNDFKSLKTGGVLDSSEQQTYTISLELCHVYIINPVQSRASEAFTSGNPSTDDTPITRRYSTGKNKKRCFNKHHINKFKIDISTIQWDDYVWIMDKYIPLKQIILIKKKNKQYLAYIK